MDAIKSLPDARVQCQGRLKTRWFFSQIKKNWNSELLQHTAKPAFIISAQDFSMEVDLFFILFSWWTFFFFSSICSFLFHHQISFSLSVLDPGKRERRLGLHASARLTPSFFSLAPIISMRILQAKQQRRSDGAHIPRLDCASDTWDSRIPCPNNPTLASRFFTDFICILFLRLAHSTVGLSLSPRTGWGVPLWGSFESTLDLQAECHTIGHNRGMWRKGRAKRFRRWGIYFSVNTLRDGQTSLRILNFSKWVDKSILFNNPFAWFIIFQYLGTCYISLHLYSCFCPQKCWCIWQCACQRWGWV